MTNYQTRFFANLSKIYDNIKDSCSDVILHSVEDGTRLQCHHIILSASSDYFRNVFTWNKVDVVEVHNGITGETLEVILRYIYTGEISITLENVSDVLVAANYFTLIEIVDDCIKFILDNLEINTSIDMYIFSWQLDLTKLTNGIVSFVAENFSYILNNDFLKQKLFSLSVHLMVELLKSNDLILRDQETDLLTRPVEREKLVLEFILSYLENSVDNSNAITSLLRCVKWPFLQIFGEEEFVFTKFAPLLDNGNRKVELESLFHVTHTDWFLSSEDCDHLTFEDKSMYATRAFSCSELLSSDRMAAQDEIMRPMAGGNMADSPGKCVSIIAKDNEQLVKLEIVTRLWDGRIVIGGISLFFASSGKKAYHNHIGILRENATNVSSVDLDKNEHIVSFHGNSGWLVDSLTFETSKMRTFGPYGGDGGAKRDFMKRVMKYREEGGYYRNNSYDFYESIVPGPHKRIPLDSILVGITGKEVSTGNNLALAHLSFIFREMLPSSNFLIKKGKKFEIPLSDDNFMPLSTSPYSDEYEYHNRSSYSDDDEDISHY